MLRTKQTVQSDRAPKPAGPYSQGIVAEGFVFVAGQLGTDPKTGKTQEGIAEQTRQCLNNVKAVLEASGVTLDDVVRVGVYLKDIEDYEEMNNEYKTFFQQFPPARTTIQAILPRDCLVEIDAVAMKP